MASIKQITLRHPSEELVGALRAVAARREESLNATILRILSEALGIEERRRRLERYATWTTEDFREFDSALRAQRTIDKDLWS